MSGRDNMALYFGSCRQNTQIIIHNNRKIRPHDAVANTNITQNG